jgi:hypothetical protein
LAFSQSKADFADEWLWGDLGLACEGEEDARAEIFVGGFHWGLGCCSAAFVMAKNKDTDCARDFSIQKMIGKSCHRCSSEN